MNERDIDGTAYTVDVQCGDTVVDVKRQISQKISEQGASARTTQPAFPGRFLEILLDCHKVDSFLSDTESQMMFVKKSFPELSDIPFLEVDLGNIPFCNDLGTLLVLEQGVECVTVELMKNKLCDKYDEDYDENPDFENFCAHEELLENIVRNTWYAPWSLPKGILVRESKSVLYRCLEEIREWGDKKINGIDNEERKNQLREDLKENRLGRDLVWDELREDMRDFV